MGQGARPQQPGDTDEGELYGTETGWHRAIVPSRKVKLTLSTGYSVHKFTSTLHQIAARLLTLQEYSTIQAIAVSTPLDTEALKCFDTTLGGPSLDRVNCAGSGRYHVDDRDIFRPLQYCATLFSETHNIEWGTRQIVHMSSLHIEELIERIAGTRNLPLGMLLRKSIIKAKLSHHMQTELAEITPIYNAAKHDVDQPVDTHLFAVEDAVLFYAICRQLAKKLYPCARMNTDMRTFDIPCS